MAMAKKLSLDATQKSLIAQLQESREFLHQKSGAYNVEHCPEPPEVRGEMAFLLYQREMSRMSLDPFSRSSIPNELPEFDFPKTGEPVLPRKAL